MNFKDDIQKRLSELTDGKEVTEDLSFRDLGLDSLDLVDLVMELEEKAGIEFEDEELFNIKTVGDLYMLVDKKLG